MDALLQDIRFAFRSLRASPLLVVAAVTSLALGLGASAAIFAAVDTFMFKPLEFEDSDRLVTVWSTDTGRGWTSMSSGAVDFQDWRRESKTLELAAYTSAGVNLTSADDAIRLSGLAVTPGFFEVLRVGPSLGRTFTPGDRTAPPCARWWCARG